MYDLIQYPSTLGDAPGILIKKLAGQEVDKALLVRAVCHLSLYAIGKGLPSGTPEVFNVTRELTAEDLASYLEMAEKKALAAEAFQLPWDLMLPLLFKLLEKWITK